MRISRFAHPVDQACAASPEVIPPARQHRKPSRARSGPLSSVGPTPLAFGLPRGDGGRPNRARHPSPATAPPLRAVVRPIFEPSSLTRTGSCRQRVVLDRVARPSPHERRHPGASPFGNQPARRCTPRALPPRRRARRRSSGRGSCVMPAHRRCESVQMGQRRHCPSSGSTAEQRRWCGQTQT
jgi:hypothetical protein